MKAAGQTRHSRTAKLLALMLILAAMLMLAYLIVRSKDYPSTDAASIDADVVHVASSVGGHIVRLGVQENAYVEKGALLFEIDPEPYKDVVTKARADLALAEASLDTRHRTVSSESSNAAIAAEQTRKAEINLAHARRTAERLRPLARDGYVPQQQLDQAETAALDAARSLAQAREQQAAAKTAVGNTDGALAAIESAKSAVSIAEYNLRQTVVRAAHNGRVVGLTVAAGEIVAPAQSLFTLIATDEWFSIGNFRETVLKDIQQGDCATVYSMIDRSKPLHGVVDGIGSGVLDSERVNLPRNVPYVERSLNWVRVSQRFPVRVKLHEPPEGLVRLGASAIIEINHGPACKR